jgi:hypothetical protein
MPDINQKQTNLTAEVGVRVRSGDFRGSVWRRKPVANGSIA